MERKDLTNCPICASNKTIIMLNLNCGNTDNSPLYQFLKINLCENCGHIYNQLSSNEFDGLLQYYNEEYGPLNIGSTDLNGDRPGSNNSLTFKRQNHLYNLILPYIDNNPKVLDVGCAMGGFLDYLNNRGLTSLYGIDVIEKYVKYANKKGKFTVKIGNAESIPFNDDSFDLIIMDQVMEHLLDPKKAFKEAKRVLVDGGLIYIGIPDAQRYNESYFFDFYWVLMREHIQHFDLEHLKLLAAKEGFELVSFTKNEYVIINEKMIIPNLNIIFRNTGKIKKINVTNSHFNLKEQIELYFANEMKKLNKKRDIIEDFIVSQKPLYVWGIGREFLYLYESTGLKKCNIIGFIDANPYKQKKFTINGKKIMDKSILEKASSESAILISAIGYINQIKIELSQIEYSGQIIEV